MAKHRVEIYSQTDDIEDICLDGVVLMTTNHDDHGWAGMEMARDLVKKIAEARGWSYQEGLTYPEDDAD